MVFVSGNRNCLPEISDTALGKDWNTDLLQILHSEFLYDCTLEVGREDQESGVKNFKCHSLILSQAIPLFKVLLEQGQKVDRDEPFALENVDAEVFECIIKHVYGNKETDFQSVPFAIKLLKLANEWQLKSLAFESATFIGAHQFQASDIFYVYDLFVQTGHTMCFKSNNKTLSSKTEEALASDYWLEVGMKTVQAFLKMDDLDIDEADLVMALIRWGKFQLQSDSEQTEKLRAKIAPALHLIRFVGMPNEQVVKICSEDLAAVLSAEEKLNIFRNILLQTGEKARSKRIPVPLRIVNVVNLGYQKYKCMGDYQDKPFSYRMEFQVQQHCKLVGLQMAITGTSARRTTFFFTVFKSKAGTLLASGDSDTFLQHSSSRCLKVSPEIYLFPGCYISIQFTFPLIGHRSGIITGNKQFALPELTASNGLTSVTLTGGMPLLFLLNSLVFDV